MTNWNGKSKLMQRCALGAVAASLVSVPAMAQTGQGQIVNTANGTYYGNDGVIRGMTSNTVVTPIETADKTPASIQFMVSSTAPGATTMDVGGGCGDVQDMNVSLVPTLAAAPGVPVYVVVTDPASNRDSKVRETLIVTVAQNGKTVQLLAKETGIDTGVFAAVLNTSMPGAAATQCTLPISGDAGLSGTYTSPSGSVSSEIASSPYNVVFDASTLKAVTAGQVSIVDASTGAPAQVFGLDGKSTYPATVTIGQAASDSQGHSYAVPAGAFTFPILGPGTYRLIVAGVPGETFASVSSPSDFASHQVVSGRAVEVTDASYGKAFTFSKAGSFSVDIPVDPQGGSLVVTNQVSTDTATPGDYLQYKVTVQNNGQVAASQPNLRDILPAGLRYEPGSLKVNGVTIANPSIAADGTTVGTVLPLLKPGQSYTITYVAVVTTIAPLGDAINTVSVQAGGQASNIAKVGVRIDGGLFSDAVTIIGRVVSDSCLATSTKAKPVPNVRILLEDGTYVMADENGQYHIENVRPGLHVAQIDRNSIPKGFHVSRCGDNVARGGNGLSQFIDARGGALWRADFYLDRDEGAVAPVAINAKPRPPVAITTPSLMGAATPGANTATPDGKIPAVVDINAAGTAVTADGAVAKTNSEKETAPAAVVDNSPEALIQRARDAESSKAAGAGINWIEQATGKAQILFPAENHNPRAPALRIVVARAPKDKIVLKVNGLKVDALLQDQSVFNPAKTAAVDNWTGVPLNDGLNHIVVFVTHEDGKTETLTRDVRFVNSADHAEYVPSLSKLLADGTTSPVIAIRVLDRDGKPVHNGISGNLGVSAPYQTIDAVQRRRDSQLISQTLSSTSSWRVDGDDGIAYVTLAPTTQTGEVQLDLHLREAAKGVTHLQDSGSVLDRRDEIRAWLSPGKQDWVVVGFAAGSAGYTTLARQAESLSKNPGDTKELDGQVKLYAKGRIKGKWLLTLAYDSDKQSDTQRRQSVLTTVDPEAYYTLYGDSTQQGYDAQSTRNLFVKLETKQFYALFGDFSTSISDTELGTYQRTLNGTKAEYRSQKTGLTAFVASTPFRHVRADIQGQGLSGPYQLGRTDIVLNTETVTIETRDRFRPELVTKTQSLVRFIDYDVDYARGTITLRSPLSSRDADLNNQFMVVDFETVGTSQNRLVAGGRATQQIGRRLIVGATAVQNDDDKATKMGVVDATVQINASTRARGEVGYSTGGDLNGHAYVAEVEHRGQNIEARGYVREQTRSFGVGQTNAVDAGFRKEGIDTAIRVTKGLDVSATAYELDDLSSDARRRSVKLETRGELPKGLVLTGSLENVRERGQDTAETSVTQLGATLTKPFLDNRLLVTGEVAKSISGDDTVSTPSRYRIGASYALTSHVRVLVDHEIAVGSGITGVNDRVGVETTPWKGGTVTTSYNKQAITENGERTYGAFGARQTFSLGKNWTADISTDSQRTIGGAVKADVVNPLDTPALGGIVSNGTLSGDYTSLSFGLARQSAKTTWTGRAEARFGSNQRFGIATGLVHQLDDGRVWGGSVNAYRLNQYDGGRIDHGDAAFSIALRAPTSRVQILDKLEGVYDKIGLGFGAAGLGTSNTTDVNTIGSTSYSLPASQMTVAALANDAGVGPVAATAQNATALRFVNNFALNWLIGGSEENASRTQLSFYYGGKWSAQSFDGQKFSGYTDMVSLEARHDVTRWLDVGIQAGERRSWSEGTTQFSIGPTIGVSPIKNSWISLGYNVTGFRDRDFTGANATVKGPWITLRMKFNEENLGLAKRR